MTENSGGSKSSTVCGQSPEAQKASLKAAPDTAAKHKNPDMTPIGSKAATGGKMR